MELQNSRLDSNLNLKTKFLTTFPSPTFRSSNHLFSSGNLNSIQHSKSNGNMQQQLQMAQHNRQIIQQLQQQQQQRMMIQSGTHPLQMGSGLTLHQSSHMPLVNSPSSGNILHVRQQRQRRHQLTTLNFFQQSSQRVKFAPEPVIHQTYQQAAMNNNNNNVIMNNAMLKPLPLQRSKSLTSADVALARGIAGLGLGFSVEDIGNFPPEVMAVVNKASEDPNQLTARCLMELATHCMNRAVEGRR